MNMVKKRINPNLDVFGVVITMYDKRTTLSKDVAKEVENVFGDKVFKTRIPRTVRISEDRATVNPSLNMSPTEKGPRLIETSQKR